MWAAEKDKQHLVKALWNFDWGLRKAKLTIQRMGHREVQFAAPPGIGSIEG